MLEKSRSLEIYARVTFRIWRPNTRHELTKFVSCMVSALLEQTVQFLQLLYILVHVLLLIFTLQSRDFDCNPS